MYVSSNLRIVHKETVLKMINKNKFTRPIVIQKAELVAHALQNVRIKIRFVFNDNVMRWCNGTLAYALWHQIKVV